MSIWIDADACPKIIKEIVFRVAIRTQTLVILVANAPLNSPVTPFIKKVQVQSGFDVADNYIVQHIEKADLVITGDIPLANAVIDNGGIALNPRGVLYTKDNIKQRLAIRDFNESMRSSGLLSGGPAALSKKEIHAFASYLDKWVVSQKK